MDRGGKQEDKLKVYLDDERETPPGWTRVYWPDEAIQLLESGRVAEISLDHDLGDDRRGTGNDVVLWIEEAVATRGFMPPSIYVHSANTSARRKMEQGIKQIYQLHERFNKKPQREQEKRLHIFDFDQTLFHSPGPSPDLEKEERGPFWHDPDSLGEGSVPDQPNENWYIRHMVEAFRQAKQDRNAKVVVMTGRSEPFRKRVEELLQNMNLEPDELILKQKKEPTSEYKIREMRRLLNEEPGIKKIHFYEDREHHLKEFQEVAEKDGYEFVPHHVSEADADRTWDEFLDVLYEGGAKKVKNTNLETRDQHPEVRADYLLKTDPNFAARIRRQFQTWVSMGKPKGRRNPSSKKARSKRVLRLTLDLSREAAVRRIARRFLLASSR